MNTATRKKKCESSCEKKTKKMIEYNEKQKKAKYPYDMFKGLSKKQIKNSMD